MTRQTFDGAERVLLCDLLLQLGPDAPTVPEGWQTRDLAAHLYMREHDCLAAVGFVIPGAWGRFAEQRRRKVASSDFDGMVAAIRSGPAGIFSLPWLRRVPNLNEYFVHHEDVRRANGEEPRKLGREMDDALWSNAVGGARVLTRGLRGVTLELHDITQRRRAFVRRGPISVVLSGTPGEILLYLFGRRTVAMVDVSGPGADLVTGNRFGM